MSNGLTLVTAAANTEVRGQFATLVILLNLSAAFELVSR